MDKPYALGKKTKWYKDSTRSGTTMKGKEENIIK